eukprot:TRINITY_DN49990_c0_g1_i1.p1 TRINITY_DN49990_c0_g1~~TRINITY_DN49990_c0_g1_i1.p1  ORF type:complete len:827 (+),score=208.54 TRINITY_DN49990_c0_g1_i1:128-2608(+)
MPPKRTGSRAGKRPPPAAYSPSARSDDHDEFESTIPSQMPDLASPPMALHPKLGGPSTIAPSFDFEGRTATDVRTGTDAQSPHLVQTPLLPRAGSLTRLGSLTRGGSISRKDSQRSHATSVAREGLQHMELSELANHQDAKEHAAVRAAKKAPLLRMVRHTLSSKLSDETPKDAQLLMRSPADRRGRVSLDSDGADVGDLLQASGGIAAGMDRSEWLRLTTLHAEFEQFFRKPFKVRYPLHERAGWPGSYGDPYVIVGALEDMLRKSVRSKQFVLLRIRKSLRALNKVKTFVRAMLQRKKKRIENMVQFWERCEERARADIQARIGDLSTTPLPNIGRRSVANMKHELAHQYATWCAVDRDLKLRAVTLLYEDKRREVHKRMAEWDRKAGERERELIRQYQEHRDLVVHGTQAMRDQSEARMRELWAELTLCRVEQPRLVFDQRTVTLREMEAVAKRLVAGLDAAARPDRTPGATELFAVGSVLTHPELGQGEVISSHSDSHGIKIEMRFRSGAVHKFTGPALRKLQPTRVPDSPPLLPLTGATPVPADLQQRRSTVRSRGATPQSETPVANDFMLDMMQKRGQQEPLRRSRGWFSDRGGPRSSGSVRMTPSPSPSPSPGPLRPLRAESRGSLVGGRTPTAEAPLSDEEESPLVRGNSLLRGDSLLGGTRRADSAVGGQRQPSGSGRQRTDSFLGGIQRRDSTTGGAPLRTESISRRPDPLRRQESVTRRPGSAAPMGTPPAHGSSLRRGESVRKELAGMPTLSRFATGGGGSPSPAPLARKSSAARNGSPSPLPLGRQPSLGGAPRAGGAGVALRRKQSQGSLAD